MLKICSRCKKEKDLTEFNFKNKEKGKLQYHCRDCSKLYVQKHYINNKDYYLNKAKKRNLIIRKLIRDFIWTFLSSHPCVDCGERDPIVLEFDHIMDKTVAVSTMHRNYTLERVKEEIAKCQIRCANCHRRKTAVQFGWHKDKMPL